MTSITDILFSDLKPDDIFIYDRWQFRCTSGMFDSKEYNAVRIDTGELYFFETDERVMLLVENTNEQ